MLAILYIVMTTWFNAISGQRGSSAVLHPVNVKCVVWTQQKRAFRLDHALVTLREMMAKLRDCAPTAIIPLYLRSPWRLPPAISVATKPSQSNALRMIVVPVVVTVSYLDKLFGRQASPHM
jgi:hypothetical protein